MPRPKPGGLTSKKWKKKPPPERHEHGLKFGTVCPDWDREKWREYLLVRASDCDAEYPNLADKYRRWAKALPQNGDQNVQR